MNFLTRWLPRFYTTRLTRQMPGAAIPEENATLCESCRHFVEISGFIPHLTGNFNTCPHCGNTDPDKLKFAAAWIRTPDEQKQHWEGRKGRTGKTVAINNGVPRSLQKVVNVTAGNAK